MKVLDKQTMFIHSKKIWWEFQYEHFYKTFEIWVLQRMGASKIEDGKGKKWKPNKKESLLHCTFYLKASAKR